MAIDELRRVNADDQMRAILEQRDKEERIQLTRLKAAESRGIEKGIEKGISDERASVARRMLDMGCDDTMILRATGLSETELKSMRTTK